MMVSSETTARRRWPSVSISHTHTHSLTVGLRGWYEWQAKQSNSEREKYSGVRDWKWEEWSKRWLRTCEMWGECAIINFYIQPCQPVLAIVTYKHLTHKLSRMHIHTPGLDSCIPTKTPVYCHTHLQKQFQITVFKNTFYCSFFSFLQKKYYCGSENTFHYNFYHKFCHIFLQFLKLVFLLFQILPSI